MDLSDLARYLAQNTGNNATFPTPSSHFNPPDRKTFPIFTLSDVCPAAIPHLPAVLCLQRGILASATTHPRRRWGLSAGAMLRNNHKTPSSFHGSPAPLTGAKAPDALIEVVWRQRRIVAIAVAVGLLAGIGYVLQANKTYTSTAKIYVETGAPRLVVENLAQRPGENYLNTQCELIRSTPIISLALGSLEGQELSTLAGVDNRLKFVKRSLNAEPGKKDDIIYVSFQGPDAVEASILVNSIVNAYVTYQSTHRKSTAAEVLAILGKEKDKRDAELAARQEASLELQKKAGALSLGADRANPIQQRFAALNDALTQAQLETINAKTRYEEAMASLANDTDKLRQVQQTAGGVVSAAEEDLARSELFALQQRLADLRRQYMPDHPSVRAAQSRIDQLTVSLVVAARQRWFTSRQREENLRQSVAQQQTLAMEQGALAAEFDRVKGEIQRIQHSSEILDIRIKELSLTENAGALDITILEQATLPVDPSSPQRIRILALALVGGLLLGIGAGLARDWMDVSLRSVEDVKAALGIPVLGVVPQMAAILTPAMKGTRVHQDPTSDVAEAYRSIRTAVYFGLSDGQAKTLLVTSPTPGDGKTTVAANLAIAMAQAGQRVLLVDGDFRNPSMHRLFGLDGAIGFSSVLCEGADLHKAVVAATMPGLHLLPCGPRPGNPAEILNSQRFSDALGDLATEFDQVVIDSPPVNAVADARILAAACDVTILVVNAERSDRKLAEVARDGLLAVGANLLGVVINDTPRSAGGFHSHQGYGYGQTAPAPTMATGHGPRVTKKLIGLKIGAAPEGRAM